MRLELTRVGLLVELANHYTTRGAATLTDCSIIDYLKIDHCLISLFKTNVFNNHHLIDHSKLAEI